MMNDQLGIKCFNINLVLEGNVILQDFNFEFQGPGIVMVQGENGAGKSCLLKVLAGFIYCHKAQVLFNNRTGARFVKKDFSFLTSTSLGLIEEYTGIEHINLISALLNINKKLMQEKIEIFKEVDFFNDILSQKVQTFSQGMRQFLRTFLHIFFEPKYLFLDEPFSYLSPKSSFFIQNQINLLARKSIVFISDQEFNWIPLGTYKKIVLVKP